MSVEWLREAADGSVVLTLHIQPGAKRTEIVGLHGEALKVRLAAPPVDGKANAALCAFLAEFCGVSRSMVTLVSGETSRAKRVRVEAPGAEAVARLRALG
ncbi:DUF167 family protein [Azoarcus sp. KH32C]|uniref:DUF167 domain-containing protein n=1 Tax=Azoarcus sp. KH32C TaxID=748247 RepID=UPI000238706D|nr:DUF167 family protein [Azoarcus sp. KH32C]BAL26129.1 hypothetical protein AZKH_3845 [Azoarcus sp. KH32C]